MSVEQLEKELNEFADDFIEKITELKVEFETKIASIAEKYIDVPDHLAEASFNHVTKKIQTTIEKF